MPISLPGGWTTLWPCRSSWDAPVALDFSLLGAHVLLQQLFSGQTQPANQTHTVSYRAEKACLFYLHECRTQILDLSEQSESKRCIPLTQALVASFPMALGYTSHMMAISTFSANTKVCMTWRTPAFIPLNPRPRLTATKCLTSVHSSPQRTFLSIVPPSFPSPFPVVS